MTVMADKDKRFGWKVLIFIILVFVFGIILSVFDSLSEPEGDTMKGIKLLILTISGLVVLVNLFNDSFLGKGRNIKDVLFCLFIAAIIFIYLFCDNQPMWLTVINRLVSDTVVTIIFFILIFKTKNEKP